MTRMELLKAIRTDTNSKLDRNVAYATQLEREGKKNIILAACYIRQGQLRSRLERIERLAGRLAMR